MRAESNCPDNSRQHMKKLALIFFLLLVVLLNKTGYAQSASFTISNVDFRLQYNDEGIGGLWKTADVHETNYIRRGKSIGDVLIRYKSSSWDSVHTFPESDRSFINNGKQLAFFPADKKHARPLALKESWDLKDKSLTWRFSIENTINQQLVVGDIAIPLFYNNQSGENSKEIFEERVIKHHFISGTSSFIFWQRPTGLGPYLLMLPLAGTSLEYFKLARADSMNDVFHAYIHSAYTADIDKRGSWRIPRTALTLAAKGKAGSKITYGFKFRWANDYQHVRDILVEEGLIDVRIAPGMSVPLDLETKIALRTKQTIRQLEAEFPASTKIKYLGKKGNNQHLYGLKFTKPGENKITIHAGSGKTYLEFFVTEPLETLYKKRAAFMVNAQQHRDPSKWYNGLFSQWDMKNKVLRGPDNTDGFDGWWGYVLACDDPGLSKAPFIAAKNVFYPDQKEIDAVEYYIEHFVWGKLQRTDKEDPYPYGIYGTPNWFVNRNPEERKKITRDQNQDKEHIWRSYDYPHIMMMYYHMYQIATMYPGMTKYLDSKGYLERANETAKAYFTYPYEILPWYETYKWGCYNELLLVDLMRDLEKEGHVADAAWLRKEWDKKVKYFIYDDPYPFRSEYAIDATAYESTHALARYAVENPLKPDSNLWYDKNFKRWYSHPSVKPEDAKHFMEKQLQANIACRGWLEPSFYYYGSDFRGRSEKYTLSYMSQMGGWSILDYALHYASDPADYIQLGYASYLSAFALINSGTAETNYGYWYPGKENDGAAGWAFEPLQFTSTWIRKQHGRGPWFYDGEIDLGYGAATRMACTVITNDPVFGWMAYGGDLTVSGGEYSVIPKDGLRRRIFYRGGNSKIDIEVNRDGYAKNRKLIINPVIGDLDCTLENRTGDAHITVMNINGLPNGSYTWKTGGGKAASLQVKDNKAIVHIPMSSAPTTTFKLLRKGRRVWVPRTSP
jgi:hypothetical protein